MPPSLPTDPSLPIDRLSAIFWRTTNSYKYLFFLALLEWLERHDRDAPIPQAELANGMLAVAWYPHAYHRLSFGAQDRVDRILCTLPEALRNPSAPLRGPKLNALLAESVPVRSQAAVLRYVQHRLLRPFFPAGSFSALKDAQVNRRIEALAAQDFDRYQPLYRIEGSLSSRATDRAMPAQIRLHPGWAAYLRRNLAILKGWALWHWQEYMSARNPNTPGVSRKLVPPLERTGSLSSQRAFWADAIAAAPKLRCIYSDRILETIEWELDHFVPWRFVAHDQLWNLTPARADINASKGAGLPGRELIDKMARQHAVALAAVRERFSDKKWKKLTEPWIADLRLSKERLAAGPRSLETSLREAYGQIGSLIDLAARQGFEPWAG